MAPFLWLSSGKSSASTLWQCLGTRVNLAKQIEEMKYESVRGEKKAFIRGWIISQFSSKIILDNYVQVARINA